jgi:hypothetical protein
MTHINTEFPYLLGPTNPCPIAVHMDATLTCIVIRAVCPLLLLEDTDYILEGLTISQLLEMHLVCVHRHHDRYLAADRLCGLARVVT